MRLSLVLRHQSNPLNQLIWLKYFRLLIRTGNHFKKSCKIPFNKLDKKKNKSRNKNSEFTVNFLCLIFKPWRVFVKPSCTGKKNSFPWKKLDFNLQNMDILPFACIRITRFTKRGNSFKLYLPAIFLCTSLCTVICNYVEKTILIFHLLHSFLNFN